MESPEHDQHHASSRSDTGTLWRRERTRRKASRKEQDLLMKKYLGSILQVIGAGVLVYAASLFSIIAAVSLAGTLILLFGIALERRLY